MKKVGILTINNNDNVGNRLQNYALKKFLENLNFEVETIWFTSAPITKTIRHCIKKMFKFSCRFRSYFHFYKFTKKYLNVKYFKSKKIDSKYDYFIVGSDQVWNYNFSYFSNDYFLTFSPKEKNVAYAASIGVSKIPNNYHDQYNKGINNFKSISVREENAKKLLESISGRKDIEILIDPTMLLTQEEWKEIIKMPKIELKRYIFTYFLGNQNENYTRAIKDFAKLNDCEIIDFYKLIKRGVNLGPQEFLYLEKNAYLVCTDSFHSSVFSILFDKPFVIFDRDEVGMDNMNSRIDTLIDKFNIKNRKFSGKITDDNINHDYAEAFRILEIERRKSLEFLKNALK